MDRECKRREYIGFETNHVIANRYKILSGPQKKSIFHEEWLRNTGGKKLAYPLGGGGTGVVFLAEQKLDKDVYVHRAIKFFVYRDDVHNEHQDSGPATLRHFHEELEALSGLNHENILKIIDASILDIDNDLNIPYLVTEFVDGPSLGELIETREIESILKERPDFVMDILLQLCRGVSYLHGRGFAHYDIAPKNILMQGKAPDLRLLIADLGLGRSSFKIIDDEEVYVAGTREYVPKSVGQVFKSKISGKKFKELQPEWDLYAISRTIQKVLNSLDVKPQQRRPWQDALCRLDEETRHGHFPLERFKNAEAFENYIAWLHPVQHTLANVAELTDSHPSSLTLLLPLSQTTTSLRVRRILYHPAILRLKRVSQLLMGSAVFPGATHSRYEHTIGTYQAVREILKAMLDDDHFLAACDPKVIDLCIVSSLLSSITRFPFSIVIHEIRQSDPGSYSSMSRENIFRELLDFEDPDNDNTTLRSILEEHFPEIDMEALKQVQTASNISASSNNQGIKFAHFILNSSIDARVVDFIRRDAIHIGLNNDLLFDFTEFTRHLRYSNGSLVLESRAIPYAEQIIALRYWLFGRIYWNSPNRSFHAMLKRIFISLYEDFEKEFEMHIRKDLLNTTEPQLLRCIIEFCDSKKEDGIAELCKLLIKDRPLTFREIRSVSRYSNPDMCQRLEKMSSTKMLALQKCIERRLIDDYSLDPKRIHLLIDIPIEVGNKKLGDDIQVRTPGSLETISLKEVSAIVKGVNEGFERSLQRMRVYLNRDTYEAFRKNDSLESIDREIFQNIQNNI